MKKILLTSAACIAAINLALSQGTAINPTGAEADNSAMLDVSSTVHGILIPRMDDDERDAIPAPAEGLLIYNITSNAFNFYKSSGWFELAASFVSSITGTVSPGGGTAINLTGAKADSSAKLDISSTLRGLLIPRTTHSSITSPATGLLIFDNSTDNLKYYAGSGWKIVCEDLISVTVGAGSLSNTGIAINNTGNPPDPSAMLDITSSSKGLLIPRMTASERDQLLPATGLTVYNISTNKLDYFNGTSWYSMDTDVGAAGSITGTDSVCKGQNGVAFSVAPITNASGYTWQYTGAGFSIASGSGTNSITANFSASATSGDLTVYGTNACGNGSVSANFAITVNSVPSQPGLITGNATPCTGTTGLTYSVTNVSGVTYTWTFPAGGSPLWSQTGGGTTNSITASAGSASGNITVTPSNSCGNGAVRTLAVAPVSVPDQPGVITGNTAPCPGTGGYVYSVTNVAGVTYTWTFPAGGSPLWSQTGGGTTNSVTATAGSASGNITVTPSNSCGSGTAQTLAVVPSASSCVYTKTECGTSFTYYEVTSLGKQWLDRNLAASRVATSKTDYQSYGANYQWGRLSDEHQCITWTSSTAGTPVNGKTMTLSTSDNPGHSLFIYNSLSPCDWRSPQNDNLWQGVSGTNNPCPAGFRIPTSSELEAERASWSTSNSDGAYASPLKLVVAGYRSYGFGNLLSMGSLGYIWSSTVNGLAALNLQFAAGGAQVQPNNRAAGYSIRCIKN